MPSVPATHDSPCPSPVSEESWDFLFNFFSFCHVTGSWQIFPHHSTICGSSSTTHGRPYWFSISINGSGSNSSILRRRLYPILYPQPAPHRSLQEHLSYKRLPGNQLLCSIPGDHTHYKYKSSFLFRLSFRWRYSRYSSFPQYADQEMPDPGAVAFRNWIGTISLPS